MAASVSTLLTSNMANTVAALDAALATVQVGPNLFAGPPASTGDQIIQTATSGALPNAYTGVRWVGVLNEDLRLNLVNVDTALGGLAAGEAIRATFQTRFGYCLFMVGQPAGYLQMDYKNPVTPSQIAVFTILEGQDTASGSAILNNVLALFPASGGYQSGFVGIVVFVEQDGAGFQGPQVINTLRVKVFNNGTAGGASPDVFGVFQKDLPVGGTEMTLTSLLVPVQIGPGPDVNVEVNATLGTIIAPGETFSISVEVYDAHYGLRTAAL